MFENVQNAFKMRQPSTVPTVKHHGLVKKCSHAMSAEVLCWSLE